MNTALLCLLAFAAWTLALIAFGIGAFRVAAVVGGKARPNSFPADEPHGPPWYRRLMRAHMNCVENLPVFGAVVLAGAVSGLDSERFGALATVYLAARVGQTLAHVASGRSRVVNLRFTFYLVQIGVVIAMGIQVAGHLM